MKFVTRTRLFDPDQWIVDILFLLVLPFFGAWKTLNLLYRASQKRGR